MSAVTHVKSITVADGTNSDIVRPSDWLSAHAQLATLAGNTAGVSTLSGTNFVFAGSNNVTVSGVQGANAATIGWNAPAGGAGGSLNVSAGTTSNNLTNITFADSNGLAFGLNASTITGSYSQSTHGHSLSLFAVSNTTQSSSGTQNVANVSFQGNGIVSVGVSNGSVVLSATQSNQAFSAGGGSSAFQTLSFNDSNGVTFTNSNGSVGATVRTNYASSSHSHAASANNGSFAFDTLSFSNANGISFGTSAGAGNAITASYTVPTVTNSSWTVSDNATSGTVARLAFTNLNGVTLSLSSGAGGSHTIVGSHNAITTARASTDAIGLNTAQSNVTWTVNSAGLSFDARGYAGTGTTFAGGGVSGSMTVNSVGVNLSLSANAGTINQTGPNIGVSTGGNTLGSTGTVSTGNVVFVGGSNITLSQSTGGAGSNATITIIGGGGIGGGVSTGGNTAGSTGTVTTGNIVFVGTNGITLSQSTGAAGSNATITISGPGAKETISHFRNEARLIATTGQLNGSSYVVPFILPEGGSFSYFRMYGSFSTNSTTLASTAATMSASAEVRSTFNVVMYSHGTGASSESLMSVASGSCGWTVQNSISVAANGTQYSVTQAVSGNANGAGTTRTTQYSISNTNYSFTTNQIFTEWSGPRFIDIPFANSLTPGNYVAVFGVTSQASTNSTGMGGATACRIFLSQIMGQSQTNTAFGVMGSTNFTTGAWQVGAGSFSTAGNGTVTAIPLSLVRTLTSHFIPAFQLARLA